MRDNLKGANREIERQFGRNIEGPSWPTVFTRTPALDCWNCGQTQREKFLILGY